LDARYRIQEDASRIKDKGKRIKVGGAGSGRKIRDKRQAIPLSGFNGFL
jgi:hypothetical protein